MDSSQVLVIGAGVGGLTAAALLAKAGYDVTVLEGQTYPGGCASTYYHQGFHFESGATVVGGFQPDGPHRVVGDLLDLDWPVRQHEPAWVTHLPDRSIALTGDNADVLARFPGTEAFWQQQARLASIAWKMSAQGLPWPPGSLAEVGKLAHTALRNFPQNLRILPFALMNVKQWLKWHGLDRDAAFVRFLDGQLLISAQTTTDHANALYAATALDLARQGVYHIEGGIGSVAQTLTDRLESLGGRILYRHHVTGIKTEDGRAVGVHARHGRRSRETRFFPADFVIANLTPWNLDDLLGEDSPLSLQRETRQRPAGWGAFVLHLGVRSEAFPPDFPDHHQVIADMESPLGETRSIFMSVSPLWDTQRAPAGQRAVTITTHTNVGLWWDLLERDPDAYAAYKQNYTERMLDQVERILPGFRQHLTLTLPGTPVTYQYYTGRHLGQVGGFPQTSLFKARGPRTGIANVRLVGDSIFPGQSTAGVTLGALRVAADVQRVYPLRVSKRAASTPEPQPVANTPELQHE